MFIDARIKALRSDPASQRRVSEQMAASLAEWHGQAAIADLRRELAAYSQAGVLGECKALEKLVSNHSCAANFVATVTGQFTAALRTEPLGEAPFRHSGGEGLSRLQLLRAGCAVLSLCAFEPRDWSGEPETVQFVDCESHEIVVAGEARGRFYRREGGAIREEEAHWRAGDRIVRAPDLEARHLLTVERSLLLLQLTRVPERPGPSKEFALSDLALIRQTSGDRRASEQVMALAVLGAMGAADSVPAIAAFAQDAEHDLDARWEAVRQLLALDTGAGFDMVCKLALRAGDALAAPARTLREQLVAAHPVLRQRIGEPA